MYFVLGLSSMSGYLLPYLVHSSGMLWMVLCSKMGHGMDTSNGHRHRKDRCM